ncbi:hypothetical protein [Almyronema epifaneia]|uniref:Uncharacterized protein n=1 Tax=Almyronema epifaneia S1 TaxID=2991925 RepID=A0ABW6IE00_9CYAN
MSNPVEIYEFSRAFDNVRYSDVYGRWVSGGYAPEKINRSNHSIPAVLRKAVTSGSFALNDSYPPLEGKVALIGCELGSYSLLAIANGQIDDGDRPTIGYRYFWLERQEDDQELDGVGTLLFWWHAQAAHPPQFEMAQALSQDVPEVALTNDPITRVRFTTEFEPEIDRLETDRLIPQIKVANPLYPDYIQCHFLAYSLAMQTQRPITWAWNVRRLENPEFFLSIYAATGQEKPAVPRTEIATYSASQNPPVERENPYQTAPLEISLKDIESRFSNGLDLKQTRKLDEIFQYLSNPYPIRIDNKLYSNSWIYSALIALLVADKIEDWLIKLLALNDLDNDEVRAGFVLQQQLITAVYYERGRYPEAYQNLRRTLHQCISNFLLKLCLETDKKQVEKRSDLLEVLGDCWEDHFREYASFLKQFLLSSPQSDASQAENKVASTIIDPFYDEVSRLIQKSKSKHKNGARFTSHKKFEILAKFFKKKNAIVLSTVFSYLNSGKVDKYSPQWLSQLLTPQYLLAKPTVQSDRRSIRQVSVRHSHGAVRYRDNGLISFFIVCDFVCIVLSLSLFYYDSTFLIFARGLLALGLIFSALGLIFSWRAFRANTADPLPIYIIIFFLIILKVIAFFILW